MRDTKEQWGHRSKFAYLNEVEIMFQRIDGYQKPGLYPLRSGGVGIPSFAWKGCEFYEAVKDQVETKRPLRQQRNDDWEFEVKDPNGYILVFSELIA